MSPLAQLFTTTGFEILVGVVFSVMLFVSGLDLVLTLLNLPTVGQYVNAAMATRQWIAVVIAVVFGAMIAHFFIYIAHA